MISKYYLVNYSIRDGEIEYGDKAVIEVNLSRAEPDELTLYQEILKQLAEDNLGEESEDWEYNEIEDYAEGINGEYRILECDSAQEIPEADFNVLAKYLGFDVVKI